MKLRPLLAAGLLTAARLLLARGASAADLSLAARPGPLAHMAEEAFLAPFAQGAGLAAAIVPPGPADVALVDGQELLAGCRAGQLQRLDWGAIGGRDRLLPAAATECGVGALVRSVVLSWDRQKYTGTPTWSEFWDVAKVPGKRGLRRSARGNLEFALIADGVAPGDVYGTLRDAAGVERAFRKLDQLKPYVVWWAGEEEAPRLLGSGEVLMTSALADLVLSAARAGSSVTPRDFAVQWAGGLVQIQSLALVAGGPAAAAAVRFLGFANDPRQQARLAAFPGIGPASPAAAEALGGAEKALSPTTAANLSAGLVADEAFWRDNGAKLEKQFETWLAKP